MPEEDVTDFRPVAADETPERCVVEQADLVERGQMHRHRVVVHEQQVWSVMFGKPRLEPAEAIVAIAAGVRVRIKTCGLL